MDHGHDSAFRPKDCVNLSLEIKMQSNKVLLLHLFAN